MRRRRLAPSRELADFWDQPVDRVGGVLMQAVLDDLIVRVVVSQPVLLAGRLQLVVEMVLLVDEGGQLQSVEQLWHNLD